MLDPGSDCDQSDQGGKDEFLAKPADELPKNKLISALATGLTAYVQRMQKRHSYFITVKRLTTKQWTPAPRESATLTFAEHGSCYLSGGLSNQVERNIASLRLENMEAPDVTHCYPTW